MRCTDFNDSVFSLPELQAMVCGSVEDCSLEKIIAVLYEFMLVLVYKQDVVVYTCSSHCN